MPSWRSCLVLLTWGIASGTAFQPSLIAGSLKAVRGTIALHPEANWQPHSIHDVQAVLLGMYSLAIMTGRGAVLAPNIPCHILQQAAQAAAEQHKLLPGTCRWEQQELQHGTNTCALLMVPDSLQAPSIVPHWRWMQLQQHLSQHNKQGLGEDLDHTLQPPAACDSNTIQVEHMSQQAHARGRATGVATRRHLLANRIARVDAQAKLDANYVDSYDEAGAGPVGARGGDGAGLQHGGAGGRRRRRRRRHGRGAGHEGPHGAGTGSGTNDGVLQEGTVLRRRRRRPGHHARGRGEARGGGGSAGGLEWLYNEQRRRHLMADKRHHASGSAEAYSSKMKLGPGGMTVVDVEVLLKAVQGDGLTKQEVLYLSAPVWPTLPDGSQQQAALQHALQQCSCLGMLPLSESDGHSNSQSLLLSHDSTVVVE